jgi:glycosyltransferase involved in cell wall biosynthesis
VNSMPVAITVVIPTLGTCPHLRGLLERLQRQTLGAASSPNSTIEVLVIANLPKQELRSLVSSMDRSSQVKFEYLETGKIGVNLARNKGLERAKGEVILFLDDDAILDDLEGAGEHFLFRHIQKHIENPEAAAIGGPYRLVDRHSQWDEAYHFIASDWLLRNVRDGHRTNQLLGGNLSVKRWTTTKGFKFDETIAYGGAETGFCQRLTLANETLLYFQDLAIGHAPDLSKTAFCKKAYLQGAGARWRDRKLPASPFIHVNQLRRNPSNPEIAAWVQLYKDCFEFGWSSDPFRDHLASNGQVKFNFVKFQIHRVRNLLLRTLPQRVRRQMRQAYAATRSIWISAKY